ncbi:hypothetical protein CVT24_012214 [Panaeolus cyanescens]|uniref:Uncharacterized protein n=1 Tax=Panaeolus cyanescens TaxID=181874 RepID=A0A409YIU7_9AGAR|nr:hypothetical protein CVT24_012214 [Panaeolus cyanescens]
MKLLFIAVLASVTTLLPVGRARSLPTLYDANRDAGFFEPLDTTTLYHDVYGYHLERNIAAVSTVNGGSLTRYVVEDKYSGVQTGDPRDRDSPPPNSLLLPETVTRIYTMDEGASTLHVSVPPSLITIAAIPLRIPGLVRDCSLDVEKMEGECVEEHQLPMITIFTEPTPTTKFLDSSEIARLMSRRWKGNVLKNINFL